MQKRRDVKCMETIKEALEMFYLKNEEIEKIKGIFNYNRKIKGNFKFCIKFINIQKKDVKVSPLEYSIINKNTFQSPIHQYKIKHLQFDFAMTLIILT